MTGQNWGLSGLKNIWPVIRTGDLLSVILSPELLYILLINLRCVDRSPVLLYPSFIYLLLTSLYIPGCNFYKSGMLQNRLHTCTSNYNVITINTVGVQCWAISIARQTCQTDNMLLLVMPVKIGEKVLLWQVGIGQLAMNTLFLTVC